MGLFINTHKKKKKIEHETLGMNELNPYNNLSFVNIFPFQFKIDLLTTYLIINSFKIIM